jgi:hypothetical protein
VTQLQLRTARSLCHEPSSHVNADMWHAPIDTFEMRERLPSNTQTWRGHCMQRTLPQRGAVQCQRQRALATDWHNMLHACVCRLRARHRYMHRGPRVCVVAEVVLTHSSAVRAHRHIVFLRDWAAVTTHISQRCRQRQRPLRERRTPALTHWLSSLTMALALRTETHANCPAHI